MKRNEEMDHTDLENLKMSNEGPKSVRIHFAGDDPSRDIVIPDINKFIEGDGIIRLPSGELVVLQPDEPTVLGDEWIYTVKLVTNKDKDA